MSSGRGNGKPDNDNPILSIGRVLIADLHFLGHWTHSWILDHEVTPYPRLPSQQQSVTAPCLVSNCITP